MFDYTKPARTKEGREARFIGKIENKTYPLVFAVKDFDGIEVADTYTLDGGYNHTGIKTCDDLENIPEKHVRYINVYSLDNTFVVKRTREEADEDADEDRTACIRVEFEDGQFDE